MMKNGSMEINISIHIRSLQMSAAWNVIHYLNVCYRMWPHEVILHRVILFTFQNNPQVDKPFLILHDEVNGHSISHLCFPKKVSNSINLQYYFLVFEEMDIYLAPHGSGLQQGGGPRPLRHKGGGGQPRIHVPAGIKGNVQGILYQ